MSSLPTTTDSTQQAARAALTRLLGRLYGWPTRPGRARCHVCATLTLQQLQTVRCDSLPCEDPPGGAR